MNGARLASYGRIDFPTSTSRSPGPALARGSASVALVFDGQPVVADQDIRLDFATQALDAYQKVVALKLEASMSEELRSTGRLPGSDMSRLFIRDLVRGSMGFVLEELPAAQTELVPTPLRRAVEETTALMRVLSSSEDEINFNEALSTSQGRLVLAVQRFAKILFDARASAAIYDDEHSVSMSTAGIQSLHARLSDVSVEESEAELGGTLLGILPDSHQFELSIPATSETVSGPISDDLAVRYLRSPDIAEMVMRDVIARTRVFKTFRRGLLLKQQTILEDLRLSKPPMKEKERVPVRT